MGVAIQDGDQDLLFWKTSNAKINPISSRHGSSRMNAHLSELQTVSQILARINQPKTNIIMEEVQC